MPCQRSSGFFSRQVWISSSRPAGVTGATDDARAGSSRRIALMTPAGESASNALRPVTISNSTAPNAKMSARVSISLPSSCSGAM